MTQPDWNKLREQFPTLEHWTYLDNARKTVPPRCQEQALHEYTHDVYQNAGADAWSALNVAETRSVIARLLGARTEEIAFTKNTTEGLYIAANGFDLHAGDNIVLTNIRGMSRTSGSGSTGKRKAWRFASPSIETTGFRSKHFSRRWTRARAWYRQRMSRTAMAIEWISLALGKVCRERNVRLVVDGVQGVGILATSVPALGADIVSMGGHKHLFGLTGSASCGAARISSTSCARLSSRRRHPPLPCRRRRHAE